MNFIQNLGYKLGLYSGPPISDENPDKLNQISENIISNDKDFNESPPPSVKVRFYSFMKTKKTAEELQKEKEEFAQREDEFLNPEKYDEGHVFDHLNIGVSDVLNYLTDTTIGKFCVNNSKFVCNSVKKAIFGKTDFEADIKKQKDESVILEEDLHVIEPLSPEATNSPQPLEMESIGIESSVENDVIIEVPNNSIEERSVESSKTLQQIKKTRKRKKNHITSLTQYGSVYFDLTEIQKNKVLSLLIAKYQEIFNDIRKEYPNCPKFNVWLKDFLENHSLMIKCDIRTAIFLNISKELNVLKRNHINNEEELNKLIELEYLTHKIIRYKFFKDQPDYDIDVLKYYSKKRLKAVLNLDFIEENLKNYFKFTFMFLDKIYNHPNNKEILEINSIKSKLRVVDIIDHPSVNLKISLSSSQIKDQLNKNINLYQAYNELMRSIIVKMRQKAVTTFIRTYLLDDDGNRLKLGEQSGIVPISLSIKNKLNNIDSILSNFDELKDIHLEEYFEIYNNLNFLIIQFKEYKYLITDDAMMSELNEISQTNSELMTMVKFSQKINLAEDASKIFTLLSDKIHLFGHAIIDAHSYGLATLLIDNNKFNKSLVIPYLDQIFILMKKIMEFSSAHPAFIDDGRFLLIQIFYKSHTETVKKIKLILANEIKDPYEVLHEVILLLSYGALKTTIKEVIYSEIKRKLAILELEKDLNKIEGLKNDLNNLYQLYDSCFEVMKSFNKIFNLYSDTSDSVKVKKKGKKQVSPKKVVNEILPEKETELTHIGNPVIPKNEALIKNEDPQIHEIEDQQIDLSHEIQDTLQNPSITPSIKIKKEKISKKREENRGSKEIFKEFTSLEDEISYDSHKKRRHLLQALRDRGWKFDAAAGKGSHLKVEGPHGTIQFVPKQEVIKHGTFNSIISSVRDDDLKNEEHTPKKIETKIDSKKKSKHQKR